MKAWEQHMKRLMMAAMILLLAMPEAFAAGTRTSTISDRTCGLSHEAMIAEQGGTLVHGTQAATPDSPIVPTVASC